MMRRTAVLFAISFALTAGMAGADEVEQLINALKPSPVDHAVWAERIVKTAGDLKDDPKAQGLLYEKAYELGIQQAKGYPAAIKAAQALLNARPEQRAAWQERLLDVYKLDWQAADPKTKKGAGKTYVEQLIAAGDDLGRSADLAGALTLYTDASRMARYYAPELREALAEKLKDVRRRQELQKEVERCKSVLAAKPDNTAVRERLIGLLVVELDKPGEAEKLLDPSVSEPLRTYVPLAVKEVGELAKPVCLEMGDWYSSLAAGATSMGKSNVLPRAKAYYERFVELETSAVVRAIGKAKLARIEKELKELGAAGLPGGKDLTVDLGNRVKMKLLRIPAGRFTMGSPDSEKDRDSREGPQHEVTISKPFYMGVTEVTQAQYQAVMGRNPSNFSGANRPVEQVSWEDVMLFCRKMSERINRNVRLPTEAQWEYACRAGTTTRFGFGDSDGDLGAYAWYSGNSDKQTHEVGKRKPNAWGLCDMYGNVWEWCADRYGATYYRGSPGTDPQGPDSGTHRVLRGGSWVHAPQRCRSAHRFDPPGVQNYDIGFRVVVSAGVD